MVMKCEDAAPLRDLQLSGIFVKEEGSECGVFVMAKKVDIDSNTRSFDAQIYGYPYITVSFSNGELVVKEKGNIIKKVRIGPTKISVSGAPDEYLIVLELL